MICNIGFILGY